MARKKDVPKRDGKPKTIGAVSTASPQERCAPQSSKKPLTLEHLRSISKRLTDWKKISSSADFSAYDAISVQAATALARYCFSLDLSGLKEISADIIRALNLSLLSRICGYILAQVGSPSHETTRIRCLAGSGSRTLFWWSVSPCR